MDNTPMTVRKYTNLDEIKEDEYRYWQSRPAHERLYAVDEMIESATRLKVGRFTWIYQDYKDLCRLPVPWR